MSRSTRSTRPTRSARARIGFRLGAAFAVVAASASPAAAQTAVLDKSVTVNGQGSSFMSNLVEQCKADVKTKLGINIGYSPTGSGAGRAGFATGSVDWAGSDIPFTAAETAKVKQPFVYVPLAGGAVAVAYRLKGVTDLRLSAATIGAIFSGRVARWNDKVIAADNPGVKLPSTPVRVVVRSDSSGTSNVFSAYLAAASGGTWSKGALSTFPVPSGNGIAQKGSDGVANYVQGGQGEGAITYTEVSFARERKLPVAKILNAAGSAVAPDSKSVQTALGAAKVNADHTLTVDFTTKAPAAYPIVTAAYAIAPTKLSEKKADVLRAFLTYSVTGCQTHADRLGYAPLPKNLVAAAQQAIGAINPERSRHPPSPGEVTRAHPRAPAPFHRRSPPVTRDGVVVRGGFLRFGSITGPTQGASS